MLQLLAMLSAISQKKSIIDKEQTILRFLQYSDVIMAASKLEQQCLENKLSGNMTHVGLRS